MLQPCESSVGGSKGVVVFAKDQLKIELSQGVPGSSFPCRQSGEIRKVVCSIYTWGTWWVGNPELLELFFGWLLVFDVL